MNHAAVILAEASCYSALAVALLRTDVMGQLHPNFHELLFDRVFLGDQQCHLVVYFSDGVLVLEHDIIEQARVLGANRRNPPHHDQLTMYFEASAQAKG